jgi:hypothetical protein
VQGLSDTARFVRVLSDAAPCAELIDLNLALSVVGQAGLATQLAGGTIDDVDTGDFEMF